MSADADEAPLWVAVTREMFEPAAVKLAQHRAGEGFETVVTTKPVEEALRGSSRRPSFVVIFGDYEVAAEREPWYVASRQMELYRWQKKQVPTFASDAAWADDDSDMIPDFPIGRIPVRTLEQALRIVDKIIEYETMEPSVEDLNLPVWVGSPGYGSFTDGLAADLVYSAAERCAPAWARRSVICAYPRSPFCGWPFDHPSIFDRWLKKGGVLAVMMGHGQTQSFHSMWFGESAIAYSVGHVEKSLAQGDPTSPVVILTCHSGNFEGPNVCLAERLLELEGGPVAVVAAATASHPLTNYYSGVALLNTLSSRPRRLGALWLSSQLAAMKAHNPLIEVVLRDVEGKLEDEINVARLKADQILMYGILGDPATALKVPGPLEAAVTPDGDLWRWQAAPDEQSELIVGRRVPQGPPGFISGPVEMHRAREIFEEADATFEFVEIARMRGGDSWEGTVSGPGSLRLVAIGPDGLRVAVFELGTTTGKTAADSMTGQ
jgi:hypothetical protein